MENLRVLNQFSADVDSDELPEIWTVHAKPEDFSESSASDYTGKFSTVETDLETYLETIKKLQSENESITKEKQEAIDEYETGMQELNMKNLRLEEENSRLDEELQDLTSELEEALELGKVVQELTSKNRELEGQLQQKNSFIKQLQESNKVLGQICEGKEGDDEGIRQKLLEMDKRYMESLKEIDELKNQLISVNVMYAESETQKELIIKKYNDQTRPARLSGEFSRPFGSDRNN